MTYAPCKDCEDRQVGCHGTCLKYMKYRLLLACKRNTRFQATIGESYAILRARNYRDIEVRQSMLKRRK